MAGDTGWAVGYTVTFKDRAENSGTPVTSGSGSVTIDRTAPSLSSVGYSLEQFDDQPCKGWQ